MPLLPFRGLATRGILKDPDPSSLPPDAWSGGSNVTFDGVSARRSQAFRQISTLTKAPAFVVTRPETVDYAPGFDTLFTMAFDGTISSYAGGTVLDVTPSGFTPLATLEGRVTSAWLGAVTYLNTPSAVPSYYGPASTIFATLPGWNAGWRAGSLRAYGDALVAFNVTKSGTLNPTLVKTSALTLAGEVPTSWDETDPTTNATENVLADLKSAIIDGCVLRDTMVIYSAQQVYSMQRVASNDVYDYAPLFHDGGIMAANCAVEVDGFHYVLGPDSFYRHDGSSKVDLLNTKNRRTLFRNISTTHSDRCFVQHSAVTGEILVAYVSTEADAYYTGAVVPNRAMVYHIASDTVGWIDLPHVPAMTYGNVTQLLTWANAGNVTWDDIGGTWADSAESFRKNIIGVSQTLTGYTTSHRLVAWDYTDQGNLTYPTLPELNPPWFLERSGLTLSETGAPLSLYKSVGAIYPLVSIYRDVPFTVTVGGSLTPTGPYTYLPSVEYAPASEYKVDVRTGGRFLSVRFSATDLADFVLTGFDADINSRGKR